ncbi:hypothetical protein Hanom_Chr13g01230321 [Helianthus anomalus]
MNSKPWFITSYHLPKTKRFKVRLLFILTFKREENHFRLSTKPLAQPYHMVWDKLRSSVQS